MKHLIGQYDLKTGELHDESKNVYSFENELHLLRIFGRAYCHDNINSGDEISSLISIHKEDITKHLRGIYILVCYNKAERSLNIYHDRSTSSVALYYTVESDKLYYSTSLKALLLRSEIKRELNSLTLEDFLYNGYIYGSGTLVKNVNKIESFKYLSANLKDGVCQYKAEYVLKELTQGQALDLWKPILDKAILNCYLNESEINAPLSSGYDSSYIVDSASTQSSLPINAFSVGGKFGKNELPQVIDNAKEYKNVTLKSALTNDSTLENLPDILWRLEGAVYESGLFLQYELSRLVNSEGKKYLICGECADQVMNINYLREDRLFPIKPNGKPMYYEFAEYPYIFGNYLILKKNGIMTNSFDIEARYPYLDDDFVSISNALGSINGTDKRCHTACCQSVLPKKVISNISKIGGATECHSLFNSKKDIIAFEKKIENSAFFKKYKPVLEKTRHTHETTPTTMAKIKNSVRNAALSLMRSGVESRRKNAYFLEEMKLRDYLCYAYIILFEKLIISGEYDSNFENAGISISLSKLL